MRAFDRGIELQFALWNVAGGTLVIADLRTSGMIGARGEVDVVVTRPASYSSRLREIGGCLCSPGILLVAYFATAWVGRVHHRRIIIDASLETDDLVWLARLNA